MTEPSRHKSGWRAWIPLILFLSIVFLLLFGIRSGSGGAAPEALSKIVRGILYFANALVWNGAATILLVGLFLYHGRARRVAIIAILLILFRIIMEGLYHFSSLEFAHGSRRYTDLLLSGSAMDAMNLILLLLLPRLSRTGRMIRAVALSAFLIICIHYVLFSYGAIDTGSEFVTVIRCIVVVLCLAASLAVAYLSLFHQLPAPHTPPPDAAATIALTCPRCNTQQTIPTNGGECPNCRLQIFIALDEGRCGKCHYPLRGLTSAHCPECGTPVAVSAPSPTPGA